MNLTHRVTVQQRTASVDAIGQPVETWSDVGDIWANVRFLRGLESIKANQDTATTQASIRTRKRSDITPAMRAVYAGVNYNITAVLPQNAVFMDLTVERVV
jgi:SPP1 family predicted phage head-tail adaptor